MNEEKGINHRITITEIERPIKVEMENEDIIDLIAEKTTDRVVDRSGIPQMLFGRDAAQTRKAIKRFFNEVKPLFLR